MKRINSNEYRPNKIKFDHFETNPDGYLYSYKSRISNTKIKPNDLPESFIFLDSCGIERYINASGIKSVAYKPNYIFNHLYKDDFLYISYNKQIEYNPKATIHSNKNTFENYDIIIWGNDIAIFLKEIEKFSGLNVDGILKEVSRKRKWYFSQEYDHKADFEKHKIMKGVNVIINK